MRSRRRKPVIETRLTTVQSRKRLYFKHKHAIVESRNVGKGTKVWAFAHILPGAVVGSNCNICDHTFIENDVCIGDRVTIKCGVQLWDGVVLEDDVFVGPNATFTNDRFPRSQQYPREFLKTVVRRGASIGANATVLGNLVIGERAMIGAGAVVTRDVPPNAIVVGNPARIIGYDSASMFNPPDTRAAAIPDTGAIKTKVANVTFHRLPVVEDPRGRLSFAEIGRHVPFEVKRYFLVFAVPSKDIRGEHSHRKQHQFLICVHGSCHVMADDGVDRQEFILDSPTLGVYLPPKVWGAQYKYSPDAVLLVLTSGFYDAEDYVRDYSEFLDMCRKKE
jgi:acetyltransferase-like isoleucine patch superfamily enzyme/dTDP-4-dehydrorhamnose 3,5-epimerase-like enzyme